MKKQKAIENKNKEVQNKSDISFHNLAASLLNTSQRVLKTEEKANYKPSINALQSAECNEIVHKKSVEKWLMKKGLKPKKTLNSHQFALEFFKQLDTKKTGEIEGETLLKSLLTLGVANDPLVLKRTLCLIFKKNHLSNLKIKSQEFVGLMKNEAKNDRILKKLNEFCLAERKSKSPVDVQKTNQLLKATMEIMLKKTLTGPSGLVTINEHLEMIKQWWKSFDNNEINAVSVDNVVRLFVTIGMATDRNDSRSLIFSQLGVKSAINFDEFQQLFAKSMLKGALSNLSKRLSTGNYASQEMSSDFKLSSYQRALMMSGVKCPNSEISVEEGMNTMAAIEKYNILAETHEK